ncbi:MAG: hypothetical protein IJD93_04380 [Ruminococcus sp.]|nr:hypothetical protein [Ruminococcus sp.]
MKDYNEMAASVFQRRDEFVAARKKRNALLLKVAGSACAVLLVAVVGISLWKNLPRIPYVKPTDPTASSVTNDTQQTENITDTKTGLQETTANPDTTKVPVLPFDPTEPSASSSADNTKPSETPSTNPTSATDPTEKPQQPSAATDPSSGNNSHPVPTDAPVEAPSDYPTEPPWVEEPTEAPTAEPWEPPTAAPTQAPWEPPTQCPTEEPIEPETGPLYIECGGKTYEAQTGDMVTLTVELEADERIKEADVLTKYGNYYIGLEPVNLYDLGFGGQQIQQAHLPNIGKAPANISYTKDHFARYKAVWVSFSAVEDEGFDFTDKKVLYTFSFIVTKPGNTKIEIEPFRLSSANKAYYSNGIAVDSGAQLEAYLTITKAQDVVMPVPPKENENEDDFIYPEESTDGDLHINCAGRTYSANVGDTVTYIVELKAEELFENIHIALDYQEQYLRLKLPEEDELAFPNLNGLVPNFKGYMDHNKGEVINPAVIMSASNVFGYNFKTRKVLVQLEFEIIAEGETDLNLQVKEMWKRSLYNSEPYFTNGEQACFEGIAIYEYVTSKKE